MDFLSRAPNQHGCNGFLRPVPSGARSSLRFSASSAQQLPSIEGECDEQAELRMKALTHQTQRCFSERPAAILADQLRNVCLLRVVRHCYQREPASLQHVAPAASAARLPIQACFSKTNVKRVAILSPEPAMLIVSFCLHSLPEAPEGTTTTRSARNAISPAACRVLAAVTPARAGCYVSQKPMPAANCLM